MGNTLKTHDIHKFEAISILDHLENSGFESRLVGGCVRDEALGLHPADYDVATTAKPDEMANVLNSHFPKIIESGIEHGTITVLGKVGQYELTTLRRDVATDGRRATIAFSDSFEDDASRRGFTINAMYEDRNGKRYDYYSGLDDIEAGEDLTSDGTAGGSWTRARSRTRQTSTVSKASSSHAPSPIQAPART